MEKSLLMAFTLPYPEGEMLTPNEVAANVDPSHFPTFVDCKSSKPAPFINTTSTGGHQPTTSIAFPIKE